MSLEPILDVLNRQLLDFDNHCLNSSEILVLRGIWKNQTYNEIAQQEGYSTSYFANVVAPELWRRLSHLTGRRVTKKNCRVILQSYISALTTSVTSLLTQPSGNSSPNLQQPSSPLYPCGAVPLNSPFYLKQLSLETQIIEEITKAGGLVRIKAPQEMGKTSLLLRILDTCEQHLGYQTVILNLQQADQSILGDINQFLRWLCVNCARKLGLKPKLNDYWDEDLGSKMSWTIYFEEYILEEIESPLVLALDEVNQVFEHPQVAEDFLPLLRSCYEEAKRLPIWQKLRLIVVHSTEIYVSLQLEQSPFNIGLPIELEGFSQQQVQQLAQQYGLNWINEPEIQQLMELLGGHPALINLALYQISQEKITIKQLLATAATTTGIYSHHLQRHWVRLQEQPELASAFQNVCQATEPVFLEPIIAYKLNSMGLIYLEGNQTIVSCRLYKEYFDSQWQQNILNN
ncbi:MAG: AAA-like domain-containing protein [Xenococcaceae cyanobacterium MO_167.B27]|nr:AAA-like domain-containing protein [Xenococcaceae cyanobacterium MO_167.B27]